AGETIHVRLTVSNNTDRALLSSPPHPVNLSYHWKDGLTGACLIFDGVRTPLHPILAPNSHQEYRVPVVCPQVPGRHLLEVALVQEGVQWFEQFSAPVHVDIA